MTMDFELLGICLDRKKIARGAHNAPDSIRRIFPRLETFVNGIDLEEHGLEDLGNIFPKSYEDMVKQIMLKRTNKFPIILGGDHSISFASVKAIRPKNFVSFDAHPDCEPGKLHYNSVTRKIVENGYKTYLYGVRCFSKRETAYIQHNKRIQISTIEDLKKIKGPTYLSIDFDILDTSIMPSVSCPEPVGLTFDQVMLAVKALSKNLIAVDFVELVPTDNVTATLIAGKLIYSTLAEIVKAKGTVK
jgi:agmatinase